jgi:histidinol-phosphate/aromatic aminotransferase/cobyric acid decarboxylase-like protein
VTAQRHGGLRADELDALGLADDQVVDFSVSLNVYGPDPAVAAAVRAADFLTYPDPTALRARRALAERLGIEADAVLVGAGAAELLWCAARALLQPGSATLIVEPAFAEWRAAAEAVGARAVTWRPERGLAIELAGIARTARAAGAAAVYLANPGNPSGLAVPADDLAELARDLGGATLVLDEAFLSLSERHADAACRLPENVVRVRSLTKDHGLAGVRVGYALATPALGRRIDAERPPWSVSSLAQAAVVAAAGRGDFVAASRTRLFADRDRLVARLCGLGLAPQPTHTIYCVVEVGAAGIATVLRAHLLARHAVAVRDCTSFGLPTCIRVAARPASDVDRLVHALSQELPSSPRP